MPSCGATDGSIKINASGGTGFMFSADSGQTYQADSTFLNLGPGVYTLIAENAAGFTDTLHYTLYGTGGITQTSFATADATCFGFSDGSLTVTATGTGPLTFELLGDTIQNNGNFLDLSAGNYTLVILDTTFCVDTTTFTINEPLELTFTSTTTDASCPASDGDITINAAGGDGSYMYSIDGGSAYQAPNFFGSQPAGVYTGVVIDGAGCTDTNTIFVNSASGFGPDIITLNFINPFCNGGNDGSITVMAFGSQPITYSNDGGQTFQANNTFTGLGPGEYDIVVEDVNGCPVGSSIVMVEPDPLVANAVALDETCVGGNASLDFSPTGGSSPFTYSIDSGATFTSTASYPGIAPGTYHYYVQDANGCTDSGSVVINAGGGPTIVSIDLVQPTCPTSMDGSIVINALSQSGPIQYSIDNGQILFPTDSFPNLGVGVYNIVLVDADGCVTNDQVTLSGPGTPVANFSANPVTGFIPVSVDFTDASIGATSYSWDFGDSGSSTDVSPTYVYNSAGTFTAILTVSDGNCTDTASVVIEIIGEPGLTVPNVFTPNGDGINDVFKPTAIGITQLHGQIFNRYGALIYEWNGPEGWWDGRTAPAGQKVADGTYFYVITATGFDGEAFEEKGIVTMVRQNPFK